MAREWGFNGMKNWPGRKEEHLKEIGGGEGMAGGEVYVRAVELLPWKMALPAQMVQGIDSFRSVIKFKWWRTILISGKEWAVL